MFGCGHCTSMPLPDCDFDVFRYVTTTSEDERVFFGSPEEARSSLQKAGLNYFLFSSEMPIGDPVVVISPLFAPDNIAKYLGLRWTDGTTSLLTWLGPDITPLSPDWLATYCRIVTRIRRGRGALLRGAAATRGARAGSAPCPRAGQGSQSDGRGDGALGRLCSRACRRRARGHH
jgi:hypothetical protein